MKLATGAAAAVEEVPLTILEVATLPAEVATFPEEVTARFLGKAKLKKYQMYARHLLLLISRGL